MNADSKVSKLILENPGMTGATLLNLLKANGLKIIDALDSDETESEDDAKDGVNESETSSANISVLRPNKSEKTKEAMSFQTRADGTVSDDTYITKFQVVIIEEGLGNTVDGFFYTKEALESAVANGVFEGKKIFTDHPSASEDQERPERSVKDICGHFENCRMGENDKGQAQIIADCQILPDDCFSRERALMKHAVKFKGKFPDKEFVGISINASGDAQPMSIEEFESQYKIPEGAKPKLEQAKAEGLNMVKVCTVISDAVSADLVTEAGAGGKVTAMLEKEKKMSEAKKHEAEEAPKHDDEQQDIALIKKYMDKYVGKPEHSEEAIKAFQGAHKEAMEMGYKEEEAYKMAAHEMKAAKHRAAKAAKPAEEHPAAKGEDPAMQGADEAEESEEKKKESEESEEKKKESEECKEDEAKKMEAEVLRLKGENAALKETIRKFEVSEHIERKLQESGLSRAVTKTFKERAVNAKSKDEVDSAWSVFVEAYQQGRRSEGGIVIMREKNAKVEEEQIGSVDLGKCF